jgi:hypothetical protein
MFLRRTVKGRGKLGISIVLMVILVAVLSCNAYPDHQVMRVHRLNIP